MSSTIAATAHEGPKLRKKKSLKQILIPTKRKSQKSLRNGFVSGTGGAAATEDDPLRTAVPHNYVSQAAASSQSVERQSESSSRAPSSAFSATSSRRPSTSKGLSTQEDNDIVIRSDRLIQTLQNVERKTGRHRASTLTNFSKPYGAVQEQNPIGYSRTLRKTSHQTLRKTSYESGSVRPNRAFTERQASALDGQIYVEPQAASKLKDNSRQEHPGPGSQTTQRSHPTDILAEMYHVRSYGDYDVRGSTQSIHSLGSSLQESKHSSTFTKISSNTELTMDGDSMEENKDGISVNDVIDLYADLDDNESIFSPNTMETKQRSIQIAEAMTAPLGSLPTPGREERSNHTPLISNQRVRNMLHDPPALQNPTSTRDHYGFKKSSRDITIECYDEWYQGYSKFQVRRNAKWEGLLADHGLSTRRPTRFPAPSTKVQRYIRKGIPPAWRGDAWFFYAGGEEYLTAQPDHYINLVVRSQTDALNRNDREAVERDLHRTFPDNLHFKSELASASTSPQIIETPIMTALRRLLCAFAVDHPRIGYCQSLNFIAGLLLLFLPEEKAYWMLHIMTTKLLPGTHELSLEGANVDLWVLMLALKQANPGMWAKVGGDIDTNSSRLPPISLCTTSWFMSVFIGTLPMESVLRVWDVLFYEGSKTLFRIALAIFKSGETQIKSVVDPMETFQVVQTLPRKMVDVGNLFDIAFGRGEVGRRWIEKKRAERREFYAKERAKEKARRESKDAGIRRPSTSYVEDLGSPATIDMASPDSPIAARQPNNYFGSKTSAIKAES